MKRLLTIACSFFVFFAGAATALASCKQMPLSAAEQRQLFAATHTHDHGDHNHKHSNSQIHCPILDAFLLSPSGYAKKDHRAERLPDLLVVGVHSKFNKHIADGLTSGPPGLYQARQIPPYLLLSVLRI